MSARWRPSFALVCSALVHLLAFGLLLADRRGWVWALALIAANHAVLIIAGLLPRSRLLGSNWVRLPQPARSRGEVAITIDDGPDPDVTPAVLDILDRYGARATFFCIGAQLAQHPAIARDIVARGHAVENHSEHHYLYFSVLGRARIAEEIEAAQMRIEALTGLRPKFFRAPAGLRNFLLDYVLTRSGLQLVSWTRRGFDTLNTSADAVLKTLLRDLAAGDILLLHDANAARTPSGEPVILAVLPRLLERLRTSALKPVTLQNAAL